MSDERDLIKSNPEPDEGLLKDDFEVHSLRGGGTNMTEEPEDADPNATRPTSDDFEGHILKTES